MRIGILTFHRAHNYGAVLQCYALQETLKLLGYDVEVIDYRPQYLTKPYRWFDIRRFISKNPIVLCKKILSESLILYTRYNRYKAFHNFCVNNLNLSNKITNSQIPLTYDIYIIGSDQVWNPRITHGFDPVFFGYFNLFNNRKKIISYAASMEAKELDCRKKEFYKLALRNFDAISVREKQLEMLIKPLTTKKVEIVLDPTLLVDSKVWLKIIKKPQVKQKYVLVYQTRTHERTIQIAENIAKQIGAIVIEVTSNIRKVRNALQTKSPEEFIGLIKYASCIVTTSFHGTAFSIIFNRPFYSIRLADGRDTRSESLLESIGLINRMLDVNDKPIFSEIDYCNSLCENIQKMRKDSLSFLKESLNNKY